MKYLVVKGWFGFGDRLESLKMCVHYAQQNKLQIYVDWTDSTWSHGSESFYTYFKLVNMPVLNSLDDIPQTASYYPAYWKDNIHSSLTDEILTKRKELNLEVDLAGTTHKSYDVVVYSSIRYRTLYNFDSAFFAKSFRVVDQNIISGVQNRISVIPLSTSIGIHARGSDRAQNNIKKERSIQFMAVAALPFASRQMIAVGDDAYSIEVWKRFYPNTHVFTNLLATTTSTKGTHNISKDELKMSKYDLTIESLVDFFTLASCDRVITTFKDSRFAAEAIRLHPYVKQILGNE